MPNTFADAFATARITNPDNARHILDLLRAQHAPPLVDDDADIVEWTDDAQPNP